MGIRGFTFAGSSRGAFQPIFESALFCSGGLMTAEDGGIHQLELRPIAHSWLIRFDLLIV